MSAIYTGSRAQGKRIRTYKTLKAAAIDIVETGERVSETCLLPMVRNYTQEVVCRWMKSGDVGRYDGLPVAERLAPLAWNGDRVEVQIAGELGLLLAAWFPRQAHRRNVPVTYFADIASAAYCRLRWGAVARQVKTIIAVLAASVEERRDLLALVESMYIHSYFGRRAREEFQENRPAGEFLIFLGDLAKSMTVGRVN